ncbi:hypothetical protein ASF38_00705 [Aeromicrobium sp. Leaf272]|nr:hypothetical protein ASF38_00705 [Aeromicrobium sp. Leaf272]
MTVRPSVHPVEGSGHPGYGASFTRDWWSFAGVMGGVTAGAVLDAVAAEVPPDWRVRTATFQYLAGVRDDPLEIAVRTVHQGRSSVVSSVEAASAGRPALLATVLSAPVDEEQGSFTDVAMPDVPAPGRCEEVELPRDLVPVSAQLEFRFATEARPTVGGDTAELVAWVRLRTEGRYGPGELAVISDAMPPALFGIASTPVLMPTADLSLVLGQHPPTSGFVLVRMRARHLDRAWAVDDCDVWSDDGALLVQSRQSRRLLGPLS